MQRQKRVSDAASIGTPPPIRMETDKTNPDGEKQEQDPSVKKPKISVKDRTFSAESAVVRTAIGVKEYFKDYCNATAIHGVRYFAEDGRYRIEKIFWVAAISLSMAGCFHLMWKVWQKWDTSPVIVSFAESSTSIWQVPFPAVSICPETKARQTVFNFTAMYYQHFDYLAWRDNLTGGTGIPSNNVTEDITEKELEQVESVSLLCDRHVLTIGNRTISNDVKNFLGEVAPQLEDMMLVCRWQGKLIQNCTDLFRPVWSDEGLCFSFNMLDNSELFTEDTVQYGEQNTGRSSGGWDLEKGYPDGVALETFPKRALGAGAVAGLYILLRGNVSDVDYLCRGPVQGFKILLHDPAEIPRVGQQYFRAPLNQEVIAAVRPSMMTTSKNLHDYAPHRRQCYFPRERQLRFFQVYTQKNCELECMTNFTLGRCGCVQFYMPRTNDTPICGSGSTNCTTKAYEDLVKQEIRENLESASRGGTGAHRTECDCLASCLSLEYDAETSQADFDWRNVFSAYRTEMDELGQGLILSRVSIFFKDTQFITSHRSELYGQTDFFASCGGLLGLFSGFSFISLIEILYFLTIRLWCRLDKRSKRRKSSAASQPANIYDPEKIAH